MPGWGAILEVCIAGLALSASPGPSMMYVLSRTLGQSRMAGYASAIGLAIGGVLLAVLSATGLAVLFKESPVLFNTVSIAGAIYLLYLAFDMYRSSFRSPEQLQDPEADVTMEGKSLWTILWQGILVEFLNPKTILFFVAFLPAFVIEGSGSVWLQMIILGMLIPLTAIPSDIIVATAGGSLKYFFNRNPGASRIFELAGAIILTLIAVRVLLSLK